MTITFQSTGESTLRLTIAMMVLAILAISLRFTARLTTKGGLALDDGLAFLGLISFLAVEVCIIVGLCTSGGTLDSSQMTVPQETNLSRYLYAIQAISTLDVTIIKLSILALYRRVFPLNDYRTHIYVVGSLCLVWFFICFFIIIFQCTPAEAAWSYYLVVEGKATCIVYGNFVIGYEGSNILLDLLILALPIRVLRSLQLSMVRKIVVGVMFILGGFIVIICILRTVYMSNAIITSTRALYNGTNWTSVELSLALLCASIPTYGPLLPTQQAAKALGAWTSKNQPTYWFKSQQSGGYSRHEEDHNDNELAVILEDRAGQQVPMKPKSFYNVV